MGTCGHYDEPACGSPQMLVSNGAQELGIGSLGGQLGRCIVEPMLSLDNGSGASPTDGYGLVLRSVSEEHCCLDSGHRLGPLADEESNAVDGCQKPDAGDKVTQGTGDLDCGDDDVSPDLGNVSSIKIGLSRMCFDETQCRSEMSPCRSNQMGCSIEWVEPLSNAKSGSRALPRGRADFVPKSISEGHSCSGSEDGLGRLQAEDRHTMDGCSVPADGDTDLEVTADFDHNHGDVSHESGNVSSIEIGLSKIYFDVTQCKGEMIPCPSNQIDHSGEHEVPSKLQHVGRSTAGNESDSTVGGDKPSIETLVEVFPNMKFIEAAVDDGYSESTRISNGLLLNRSAAVNFTYSFGGSDHVEKQAEGNRRTDDDMCKIDFLDASSSSLRRSSRTRKCAQKIQGGKHPTKCSKKASNLSHCGTIDLLSKATRKKRSCLSRSLCPSGWGLSGNLSKYFDGSNGATGNQVLDKVSKRGKVGQRSKKKQMLKVVASSQISEGIQGVPCRPIRLKVTFGKKVEQKKVEVMPSEAVDAQAVLRSSGEGNKPALCLYMQKTVGESTCPDTVQLEPQKLVSSHADKYVDPGTSPDSEVIDQVVDSSIVQSTLTVLHNPVNIVSDGIAVAGNASFSFPSKESKKKRNKKDKLCEASNVGIEDKMICQAGADKAKKKKRNKKDKLCEASNLRTEDKGLCQAGIDKAKSKKGRRQRISRGFCFKDSGIVAANENPSCNFSGNELISMAPLSVSEKIPSKATSLDNGADSNTSSLMAAGIEPTDSENFCLPLSPDGAQGKRTSKGSKTKGKSRNESKVADTTKKQRESCGQLKGNKRKEECKSKVRENDSSDQAYHKGSQSQTGKYDMLDVRQSETGNGVVPENVSCLDDLPAEGGEQILPPRVAWVCCDDCNKWRCISAKLADIIEETHCRWTCKDNQDQAFADCSIRQEKSNAEINAELQISDEEDGRDGHLGSKGGGIRHAIVTVPQPSTWMLIKSNLFLHRSRKTQTMDEIMVCHCKPPAADSLGCGSQCLNRMLNIECVQGTCPCGDLCSNQQFQKRQYAKLNWFRCGKKGYGLQASEDISKGQFLIEYVGEVLDLQAYEARQKEYASKGYKHFYFMTLNGNEVIDACAKGNLGRFVNHSCDPNCRTEKWVVNGEICVGLFALRSIRKGEELTFDYNYVRVFGAAAKKCHCGSHKCQGYIGGDPHNADQIVQGDSDEEFPEPVVIDENGEIDHALEDVMAKSRPEDVELVPNAHDLRQENLEVRMDEGNKVNEIDIGGQSPTLTKMQESDKVESSENLAASQSERVRDETMSTVDQLRLVREHATSTSSPMSDILPVKRMVKNSLSGSSDSTGRISEVDIVECERSPSKRRPRMKISRPSKSVKDRKSNSNSSGAEKVLVTGHRTQLLSYKPRKLLGGSVNGHLEAVEEKLNELLDIDGGICKRKDASKGYLKLLLLTAASGDSGNGGAIQSNRDLSMILDAMLKTKSRGVLLDIINKNGLQMLHNMMKLYRRDFKKIPILRKLLKVLEFLAEREILTVERINGDPLCPGVESFRESILCLTEHEDKKVHQIARNFRDRWIPRPIRKFNGVEKPDRKRDYNKNPNSNRFFGIHHHRREYAIRRTEAIDCVKQSEICSNPIDAKIQEASSAPLSATQTILSRPRKRKSRWDQDKEPNTSPLKMKTSPVAEKIEGVLNQRVEAREEKSLSGGTQNFPEPSVKAHDPMQTSEDDAPPPGFCSPHICEDAPPGFSSLQRSEDAPPGFSSLSPQNSPCLKYLPAVSKGYLQERFNSHLPVSYGIPFSIMQQLGTLHSETIDSWVIAPAIPFQPYPPLPSYPRNKSVVANRGQEEMRRDQGIPSTSGIVQPYAHNPRPTNQHLVHQERGFSNGPGRRYHRQQKWNNQSKWRRPWFKRRNGWGFKGNHPRNGMFMGVMTHGQNGQHLIDVNQSVEFAGNSC